MVRSSSLALAPTTNLKTYANALPYSGAGRVFRQSAVKKTPYSGAGDVASTISNWLGIPIQAPDPNNLPTLATTKSFVQGRRYAAGIQAPNVPIATINAHLDMLPGFTGAVVYTLDPNLAPDAPGQFPGTVPQGVQPGANFVITATRSDPSVQDMPLPPNVLWVVDYLPDVPTPTPSPDQVVPDHPSTPAAGAAAGALPFGLSPMAALGIALAGVVGIVLVTSHHEKSTRTYARS